MIQLRKTVFTDNTLTQFQAAVEDTVSQLNQVPILDGILLTDVSVGTSQTIVNHKLGRKPRGYMVVSQSALATVANQAFTSDAIPMVASTPVTLSLWVF